MSEEVSSPSGWWLARFTRRIGKSRPRTETLLVYVTVGEANELVKLTEVRRVVTTKAKLATKDTAGTGKLSWIIPLTKTPRRIRPDFVNAWMSLDDLAEITPEEVTRMMDGPKFEEMTYDQLRTAADLSCKFSLSDPWAPLVRALLERLDRHEKNRQMFVVASVRLVSRIHPQQWEGRLEDDDPFFIRWQDGMLSVFVDDTMIEHMDLEKTGDTINFGDMIRALRDVLTFSEKAQRTRLRSVK